MRNPGLRRIAKREMPPLRQGRAVIAASLLQGPRYGLALVRGGLSPSVVFPAFKDWEKEGLIEVCDPPPGMESADDRIKWYRPTREGTDVLTKAVDRWKARHRVDQIRPIPITLGVTQS